MGAVLSAMWFAVDTQIVGLDRQAFALDRIAGLEGQTRFTATPSSPDRPGVEFRGFRFPTDPSRDKTSVELLLYYPDLTELRSLVVDLVWDTSDWRLVFPETPLEVTRRTDSAGFVAWSDPAATTSTGLGRPAPGWSQKQPAADDPEPDPPYTERERRWADGLTSESGPREFAAMSHAERTSKMTPNPPLSKSEKRWLKSHAGVVASYLDEDGNISSDFLGMFYGMSHDSRAGLQRSGTENGGGSLDTSGSDCAHLDLLACGGLAKDKGTDLASNAAGALADSAFGRIAESAVDAAELAMKELMTAWLKYPSPEVSECYGGSASCQSASVTAWTQAHLHWLVVFAMVVSIMIGAIRMMVTARGEHARELGTALVRMVLVTFGAGTVIATSLAAGEIYSQWILDQADFNLNGSLLGGGVLFTGVTNPFMLLILGLLMLLVQIVQFGLMAIRSGMVIVLAAFLPLASSVTNTAAGRQWSSKSIQWLAAWILYKPVAATIYAIAIQMTQPKQGLATQLAGIFMMILAILALPALIKFAVPWVAAAANGSAGAVAAGVAGGLVATGAMVATGGASAAMGGGFAGMTATGGRSGGGGSAGTGGITAAPTGSGDPGPTPATGAPRSGGPDIVEPSGSTSPAVDPSSPGGSGTATAGQATAGSPVGSVTPAASAAGAGGGGSPAGAPSGAPVGTPAGQPAGASPTPTGQAPRPATPGPSGNAAAAAQAAVSTARTVTENTSGAVESERHA
ncbi:hypothetical protein [Nocardioides sp. Root140]|uniref:hypothetical protein n=1 Tax=Nocardioides sp. Root140 TaxID=1736460 RepID=UPI0012E34BC1|nr:hypothetical protein [Nocardioides sp. Root140]